MRYVLAIEKWLGPPVLAKPEAKHPGGKAILMRQLELSRSEMISAKHQLSIH